MPLTVALIRTRYLGDTILLVPLIRAIQSFDRSARIVAIVNEGTTYPLERFPGVELHSLARSGSLARGISTVRLSGVLRKIRPDLLLDLTVSDRSRWLSRASGARRSGAAGEAADLARGPWEIRIPVDLNRGPESIVAMHGHLLSALGIPMGESLEKAYFPDPQWIARAGRWIRERDLESVPILFLHPGGRHWFKRWPPDRFARLAALWMEKNDGAVIVAATGGERTLADSVLSGVGKGRIFPLIGTPVGLLDALIRRARVFVGNDSGPLHMADAAHVPLVGLFGSTLPAVWGPTSSPRREIAYIRKDCSPCHHTGCSLGGENCLASLSVTDVFQKVESLL